MNGYNNLWIYNPIRDKISNKDRQNSNFSTLRATNSRDGDLENEEI